MKRALCIGINQYPDMDGQRIALTGCVPDATRWATTLRSLGFDAALLTDQNATHSGFLTAVRQIVQSASSGDILAITYSGHGVDAASSGGRTAEGLCPIDFQTNGFIVDNDIGPIFDAAQPGVAINFILDSCFSGAVTRFLGSAPPATRAMPSDVRVRRIIPTPAVLEAHQRAHAQRSNTRALSTPGLLRECIFAASADNQVSLENGNGGYFTQSALQVINSSQGQLSNASFVQQVIPLVATLPPDSRDNGGIPQHPQCRCPSDLQTAPFLGSIAASTGVVAPVVNPFIQPIVAPPPVIGPLISTGPCHLPQNPTASDLIAYLQCISATTRNFQGPNH